MTTINTILKELKNVPVSKLDDIYAVIRSIKSNAKKAAATRRQILAFAGCFNDLSINDYNDFLEETKRIRSNLFDRDIYV